MYRSSPYDRANLIADFDSIRISSGFSGKDPELVPRRSHQAGDHQLPDLQAGARRAVLRPHFRPRRGLGMLVRQVQAHEASRRDLRQVRRRSDAVARAPRAPGPYRTGQPLLARLVLQGPAEPHRPPARYHAARTRARALFRSLRRSSIRAKSPDLSSGEVITDERKRAARPGVPRQVRRHDGRRGHQGTAQEGRRRIAQR